jgi:hypothetical protein
VQRRRLQPHSDQSLSCRRIGRLGRPLLLFGRCGSNSALGPQESLVRSSPRSGHAATASACRFRANCGSRAVYSTISSALASSSAWCAPPQGAAGPCPSYVLSEPSDLHKPKTCPDQVRSRLSSGRHPAIRLNLDAEARHHRRGIYARIGPGKAELGTRRSREC